MSAALHRAALHMRAARLGVELLQVGTVWRLNFASFGDAGELAECSSLEEVERALREFEGTRIVFYETLDKVRA